MDSQPHSVHGHISALIDCATVTTPATLPSNVLIAAREVLPDTVGAMVRPYGFVKVVDELARVTTSFREFCTVRGG